MNRRNIRNAGRPRNTTCIAAMQPAMKRTEADCETPPTSAAGIKTAINAAQKMAGESFMSPSVEMTGDQKEVRP